MNYSGYVTEQKDAFYEGVKGVAISFLASVLIALASPIALHLPFTPVPITFQVHMVLFFAAMLGAQRGALMVAFFLLQGAMGFPVFAGGASGIWTLIGPRGGYLIGYLVAAFTVGTLQERSSNRSALNLFFHMAIGNLIIYAMGAAWLAQFVGASKALFCGVMPFLPGDLIKLFICSKLKRSAVTASL